MGRTGRIRRRLKKQDSKSETTAKVISLMKWMGDLNWKNTSKIFCRHFEATGRGVTSNKSLYSEDVLINAPFELLITYSTLSNSEDFMRIFKRDAKLGIQDMLAAFLVLERHKKNASFWKFYLETLPSVEPTLPWFYTLREIQYFPEELKAECLKCRTNFEDSFKRIKGSLRTSLDCKCCIEKVEKLHNLEFYRWGYIMVNTRGVYIDPSVVKKFSKFNILLDEPQIAMFPMMDMFNHSDVAENKIEFKETTKGLFYQLVTLNDYKKHDQIFISYGRHDNTKLFAEYGFYLPFNSNDKIKFSSQEIISCLKLKLNNFQFEFLKKHDFLNRQELFVSLLGPSFKLKGFLFVALNESVKNYSSSVFSEDYDGKILKNLKYCSIQLLDMKIGQLKAEYLKFCNEFQGNEVVCNFLQNRIQCAMSMQKEMNRTV